MVTLYDVKETLTSKEKIFKRESTNDFKFLLKLVDPKIFCN